ncbi:MAG: BatA domain-containing protein [Gemmatimonadaceae bacterium]|nr:BatA domain-containing protein [Gemmatimonadaceae bacterium]
MTLLAPWVFALGAALALVVVALHFLTTRRPPARVLPTARFVPVAEARAVSRASRPSDVLLLVLRVFTVLLVSAAFARPVLDAPGPQVRSVVLVDVSRAVADTAAAMDSARAQLTEGGALVLFGGSDAARSSLSAALVRGQREAARVARGADSVKLVVVAPFTQAQFDAATQSLRDTWPGALTLVRVPIRVDSALGAQPQLVTSLADDPVAPALGVLPARRGAQAVRIVRARASGSDSAWARNSGGVLVEWPLSEGDARADGVVLTGEASRAESRAVAATLVAPLVRMAVPSGALVQARWRDGTPAVVEDTLGAGCIRHVGVGLPIAGDLTLREPFVRFLARMVAPCGMETGAVLSDSSLAVFAAYERGTGVAASLLVTATSAETRLAAWLLAAALCLLLGEWALRTRRAR